MRSGYAIEKRLEAILHELDSLILATPTGLIRNMLTEANINILEAQRLHNEKLIAEAQRMQEQKP